MRRGFITNRLRSGKKSLEVPVERKIETIQGNGFTWIDLQNPDREDVEKLAPNYNFNELNICLLYTSPSPRDVEESRMPSSA